MTVIQSPLRYPGGKSKLFPLLTEVIRENSLFNCIYREPYAGGAGLALNLLRSGFVSRISLNDFDLAIYSFWKACLESNDEFVGRIESVKLNIDEWHKQKEIWKDPEKYSTFELGFATYYLNRTNRSGIIEGAGPIGGYNQSGAYKIDARFNISNQIRNLRYINDMKNYIDVSFVDAAQYISNHIDSGDLIYLDPPYYVKGRKLYRNSYNHSDHELISDIVRRSHGNWMVSYDDVEQIRKIYGWSTPATLVLDYSAGQRALGREVLYFSPALTWPSSLDRAA